MKKLLTHSAALSGFLIVVYFLGLVLGSVAVSVYPIFRQKKYFNFKAHIIAQEYLQGEDETLHSMSGANMYIFICDDQGSVLQQALPNNNPKQSIPNIEINRHMPRILSEEDVFSVAFTKISMHPYNNILVVTGVPVIRDDRVVGAVFLAKNLMDLPEAIIGYVVYFTLFFWLSAYFIVSNIRKNKKLDKLRQNYIANVTHALKTPVASIKALSETLCDEVEPDPDRQKVYYGMILREANRQDHMIRDILELSKLQSNGMDFSKTKLSAPELLAPIQDKYATLCDCMDIHLHISNCFSCLPTLYSNAACVRQVFEILLDNALKFVPEGGNIWVDASVSGKIATFCVRDDGMGIEKDALPQVFDRFFKGSHDFNASGSGLGLAIAKEIILGLKERIWAESEAGKGAAFYFTVHLK